jgi:hypothetical protein
MHRPVLTQVACLVVVALTALARPAAADDDPTLKIVLQVPDESVPLHLVLRAKSEVDRIYQEAGVAITWKGVAYSGHRGIVEASDDSPPGFALVVLSSTAAEHIAVAAEALGGATGTPEEQGRIAYVFFDRVENIARAYLHRRQVVGTADIDTVIVLAHAMAHEIGHLLLPYGHSPTGLMRADWNAADLRGAVDGDLNFTAEQAASIRRKLLPPPPTSTNADGS